MRLPSLLALASLIPLAATHAPGEPHASPARVTINDNRSPAGTLRGGVLTVDLEAREGEWHPDADPAPGIRVRAFAERGKDVSVPGPLLRVPEGTVIHARITNALGTGTLVVHGLSTRGAIVARRTSAVRIPRFCWIRGLT